MVTEKNIICERRCFYQRCQDSSETLIEFVNDLLKLSASCDFQGNSETLVRDRVIFGLHDEGVQAEIIQRGGNPSLKETVALCEVLTTNSMTNGATDVVAIKSETDYSMPIELITIGTFEFIFRFSFCFL